MSKHDVIEGAVLPKQVTTQKLFRVVVKGQGGILMNKLPDLSISKASKANQAKEDPIEKEQREWRNKLYFRSDIGVYIPGEVIHETMKNGAKYWGAKIAGEGMKTYTDVVASAVIAEDTPLGIPTVEDERIIPFGKVVNGNPSKGKNSGCRVYKIRPLIMNWQAEILLHVFDARLTPDVLLTIMTMAGTFKGFCDWRPQYGRFAVVSLEEVHG